MHDRPAGLYSSIGFRSPFHISPAQETQRQMPYLDNLTLKVASWLSFPGSLTPSLWLAPDNLCSGILDWCHSSLFIPWLHVPFTWYECFLVIIPSSGCQVVSACPTVLSPSYLWNLPLASSIPFPFHISPGHTFLWILLLVYPLQKITPPFWLL